MTKNKKIIILVFTALLLFGLLYATTYIPKKIINISPMDVSKIVIFDGTQGESLTITDSNDLEHIITNLNNVIFSKGNISVGYMGYAFRVTIYKQNGKKYKELIINSSNTIRYRGFFYKDKLNSIDFEYIKKLFD